VNTKYKIGDSRVIESREAADGMTIRRRRESLDGKTRFTTYERIERPSLEVEEMINNVEDRLYDLGESEVTSHQIGDMVLDELATRNEVAYVRFASVYHEFKTLDEFEEILKQRRTD
jgi:transcriptional repressor NrdR